MTNIKDHSEISSLVSRFLDGETSLDEEKTLYAFFSRQDIPAELEPYRRMFGWYAALAAEGEAKRRDDHDEATTLVSPPPAPGPRRRHILLRPRQWAAIAAMLALLFTVGFFLRTPSIPEEYLAYEGSYIVRDGKKITDLRIVVPEILRTQQVIDESLESINAMLEETDGAFDTALFNSCDLSDPMVKDIISANFDL